MSTMFGVKVKGEMIEVAHRSSGIGVVWTNDLARALPSSRRVYALDNTPQGIYTIKDIKNKIKEG